MPTTIDASPLTETETLARAALAELIAKHDLPEPAAIHWTDFTGFPGFRAYLSLTTWRREDVTPWAEALRRKVKTVQAIRASVSRPGDWACTWDTSVTLPDWRPGVKLTVHHDELRHARTAAAEEAGRQELISRVLDSALGGGR